MNVLIAIDSFKGSLSSAEASQAIAAGIRNVDPEANITSLPLADGGEGTVEALVQATKGSFETTTVTGPFNDKVQAEYGILNDKKTAVIEVAAACGLPLVPEEQRDPLQTTTFGVGELIMEAIHKGCRHFIIGLGGSATNDAGVGMLQALGFRFYDKNGQEVGQGGQVLERITDIDMSHVHPELKSCTFNVACDVNNPLYGKNGAAYIYGPQKGADPTAVERLDTGLKHFGTVVHAQLGLDLQHISGAGAAGGLGAAFSGFLNGSLQSGVELILETIQVQEYIAQADWVMTGEGKLDGQTMMGKAPLGIAKLAKAKNIPVIALAGDVDVNATELNEMGITAYFSVVSGPMSLEQAMDAHTTYQHLTFSTEQLFRLMQHSKH